MGLCKEQLVAKAFCVGVHRLVLDWHRLDSSCYFCLNLWTERHQTSSSQGFSFYRRNIKGFFLYDTCRCKPIRAPDIFFFLAPSLDSATSRWSKKGHPGIFNDIVCAWEEWEFFFPCWGRMEGRQFFLSSREVKDVDSCRCLRAHWGSVDGSRVAFNKNDKHLVVLLIAKKCSFF